MWFVLFRQKIFSFFILQWYRKFGQKKSFWIKNVFGITVLAFYNQSMVRWSQESYFAVGRVEVTGSYFRMVVDDGGGGIAVTPSRPDEDGAERLKENYRYPITLNNFLDAGPRIPWLCERLCFAMTSNNPCTKGEPPAVLRTSTSRWWFRSRWHIKEVVCEPMEIIEKFLFVKLVFTPCFIRTVDNDEQENYGKCN